VKHVPDEVRSIYAELERDIEPLRTGKPSAVEMGIQFLELDPWFFRSGYMKETLIRLLRRQNLTEEQATRLRNTVLAVVDKGDRREFRHYCRLAVTVEDANFRRQLLQRLRGDDPGCARRALWILTRLRDVHWKPKDVEVIQELLVREANDKLWWRVQRWICLLVARFWDARFERELINRITSSDPDARRPALRILSGRRLVIPDAQREVLTRLFFEVIDRGGDGEEWFEGMAATIANDQVREGLNARLGSTEWYVRRRARWALNSIIRTVDGEPGVTWRDV